MSIRTALSAFAHRGAQRGSSASFVVYSALLTMALLALAGWIVPDARAADADALAMWWRSGNTPAIDPSLWTTLALADVLACWLLVLGGFVVAPAMVAAAVANERRAGTLDQLRTTPLSPLGLAGGIIVGVPARLYLLCAGPLALHVTAFVVGPLPLSSGVQSLAVLAAGTAASCALGLCVALAPRQESGGTFAAVGVAALLGLSGLIASAFAGDRHLVAWSFLHPAGALDAVMLLPRGLWRRMVVGPWGGSFDSERYGAALALVPLLSVAASLGLGALWLRAACRKLAAPERPLFSKLQAVVVFGLAALALLVPLWDGDRTARFDSAAVYGLTALMLPALVTLGLLASPTFEAWALAARRGGQLGWRADDASAHRAVWLMEALWVLLVMVTLRLRGWHLSGSDETLALGWTTLVALTLPVYLLFASTRYATVAARWAFGVAVAAHLVGQLVAIAIVRDHDARGFAGTFVTLAGVAAVCVPGWVALRQRALRRATLAR